MRLDSWRCRQKTVLMCGLLAAAGGVSVACGALESQTRPTAFDAAPDGTVLRYQDGAGVPGVTVSFGGASAVTDANGRFHLFGVPASGPLRVTATAPGYLERAIWMTMPEPGGLVQFDVIEDAEPFLFGFYREFARNGHEQGSDPPDALRPLDQWTVPPRFYFKTTLQDGPGQVPAGVVDLVVESFTNSVPDLSGGRLHVAGVEVGSQDRPIEEGWVNVYFHNALEQGLGSASVGGNSGIINLTYDPSIEALSPCPNITLSVANHEIVHTMGFWHTDTHWFPAPWVENPFRTRDCRGSREPITRYHAAVAYSRVRLNRDEDLDPTTPAGGLAARADAGRRPVVEVYCGVR